jgi:hypothetical protein
MPRKPVTPRLIGEHDVVSFRASVIPPSPPSHFCLMPQSERSCHPSIQNRHRFTVPWIFAGSGGRPFHRDKAPEIPSRWIET